MLFKNIDKLKPYQVEGANFALSSYYSGNRDKPGMGKTAQALLFICKLIEKNPNTVALVIVPTGLRLNWGDEIKMWTNLEYNYYDHKKDLSTHYVGSDIVIVTYHQVTKYPDIINHSKFNAIVIDEFHNFKNPKSLRTLGLLKIVDKQKPDYLLQLSGTPIKKKVQDLFVALFVMGMGPRTKPRIQDKYRSYFLFCYRFTNVIRTPFGTVFKGVKNLEELRTYIEGRFLGRDPEKVLDLPEFVDKYVTVDYRENPELLKEFTAFNDGVKSAPSDVKAASALLKAPFTLDYVLDLHEQEVGPIVVFTDHHAPADYLEVGFKKAGLRVCRVTGVENTDARALTVKKFQAGEYDVAVCTYGGAAEGHNMTAACHLVLNDFHWVPEIITQARGRIRRMTQRNRCVYHIMGGAKVDKKIWASLQEAIKVIEKTWRSS